MKKIAVLIPAHNEETVIKMTIDSCIPLVGKENVYVVDDGSSDNTSKIAKESVKNVLTIQKNAGKANALNTAIEKFKLTKKYEYIMPVNSDTVISKNFFKKSIPVFEKDEKIVCVVGKVVGRNLNWITTYRAFEYEVNQAIHKSAQSGINGITVCPGPSTIYRAWIFEKIKYSKDTCTEDMDFTFNIHRKRLGRIVYEPSISVSTQDPKTLKNYIKQLVRWYTGFWQSLAKHDIPFGGQSLDFEAAILATDGILNLMMVLMYLLVIPVLLTKQPLLLLVPPVIDFSFFMMPMVAYVAVKQNKYEMLLLLPHFYLMRLISSLIFIYSFFKFTFSLKNMKKHTWETERYNVKRREVWAN